MTQFGDTSAPLNFFQGYTFWFSDPRAGNDKELFRPLAGQAWPCCSAVADVPHAPYNLSVGGSEIYLSGQWDSILTDVTDADEQASATLCTIVTQEPTTTPTADPTTDPTTRPTGNPSRAPTQSPTLGDLNVPSCKANVLPRSSTFNITWEKAPFDPPHTAPAKLGFVYVLCCTHCANLFVVF